MLQDYVFTMEILIVGICLKGGDANWVCFQPNYNLVKVFQLIPRLIYTNGSKGNNIYALLHLNIFWL